MYGMFGFLFFVDDFFHIVHLIEMNLKTYQYLKKKKIFGTYRPTNISTFLVLSKYLENGLTNFNQI